MSTSRSLFSWGASGWWVGSWKARSGGWDCCHPRCFNKLYNDIKASDVVLRRHLRTEHWIIADFTKAFSLLQTGSNQARCSLLWGPESRVRVNVLTWTVFSLQQVLMCRTSRSSLARAFSLSLKRFSASRSLSSSSCSRLCCLCRSTNSPVDEAALVSLFAPTCPRLWHSPAAGSCSCCSSSKMESCLMTAAWNKAG